MVKLSLQCAVVGQAGSSFDVDIDDGAKVSKLKKAIWEEIKEKFIHDDKFRSVVASDLQLFLAKKANGAWLTDNEDLDTLLQSEIDTSSYLNMRASWKLSKPTLFGGVSLGEDVVHVLVVVQSHVRVDIGETGFRALKYKRYRRWIINVQCFVPVILAIITIIVLAYGENPTDEKGCLIALGRSLIVCRMVGVDIAVGVILSLSQYWKAKLDDIIDEAKNKTPLQAQQRTMTYHAAEVQQQELIEQQASTAGLQRQDLTELSSLLPADEAHRQTQPQQGSRISRRKRKK